MATFPGAVKSFDARSNGQTIDAAHVGDLQDEVNAMQDGYLNGTARLNSSHSTVVALSVTGGSTFANVAIGSTAGGNTLTVRGSTTTLTMSVSTRAVAQWEPSALAMASGSTHSLGTAPRGFLFVDESANAKGGIFYLRGTGNLVTIVADPDSELSTVIGGGVNSTNKLVVGFDTDHYTLENRLGGATNIRLTLMGS